MAFIDNLRSTIDRTAVYDPIGKYGKPVLNERETADAKLEKLLLADPKALEDIIAYVRFVESLDAMKNSKIRKKVKAILREAEYDYSKQELARVSDALRRVEVKRIALISVSIILFLLILFADIYWYSCKVQHWGLFGKICWWGILAPYTLIAPFIPLIVIFEPDYNPFRG